VRLPVDVRVDERNLAPRTIKSLRQAGLLDTGRLPEPITVGDLMAIYFFGPKQLANLVSAMEGSKPAGRLSAQRGWSSVIRWARVASLLPPSKVPVELMSIQLPRGATVDEAALEPRTARSLHRAGLFDQPGLLPTQTVGTLVSIMGFGPVQLIDLVRHVKTGPAAAVSPPASDLEEELRQLLCSVRKGRDQQIVRAMWGWDGTGRKTLQAMGEKFGLTRERVRQISQRMERQVELKCSGTPPHLPVLSRAIELLNMIIPAAAGAIQQQLIQEGITRKPFALDGLVHAAALLRNCPDFQIVRSLDELKVTRQEMDTP
jgi:hypothetical protein